MFFSRVQVVLFTIGLSCQQYKCSHTVTAFRSSLLPISRILTKKSFLSLDSAKGEENPEYNLLLDESILLYSQISRGTCFENNDKTEVEDIDKRSQQKDELTSLIEDMVFDENGTLRDGVTASADNVEKGRESPNNIEENKYTTSSTKEPSSLVEISRALDEQILLGTQSTFTEEELEQWVGRIDSLRDQLQSQLIALPATSSATTTLKSKAITTAPASIPTTPLDRLRMRLESVRTSIESAGNS